MCEENTNSVAAIRSVRRKYLKDLRNEHKESLFSHKRLGLQDVSEYIHDISLSEFNILLSKLKEKSVEVEVLRKIKNSCISHEYIETFLRNDGAFNSLIRIFIGNDAQKQLEAASCLTNIACGSHKCTSKVSKLSGAYLVSFSNGSSHFLQEQSLWTLGNIANDCLECFNIIKAQGVLPALLNALQSPLPDVIQSAVFALNACTQYDDSKVIDIIQPNFIRHLVSLLEQDSVNKSIFLDTAFTLCNCCFLSAKYSLNSIDIEDIERILFVLQKVTSDKEVNNLITIPVVRCLGFLSYDFRICDFLALHSGFFASIQVLTSKEDYKHQLKEAIWVLSNVIVGAIKFDTSYLMPIIENMKINVRIDNDGILQLLYFLSVLASKDESVGFQLKQYNIFTQIEGLRENEDKDILDALTIFFNIVKH